MTRYNTSDLSKAAISTIVCVVLTVVLLVIVFLYGSVIPVWMIVVGVGIQTTSFAIALNAVMEIIMEDNGTT